MAKQQDLPGLESRKIPALHEAAMEYCDIRDQRMQLTEQEVGLKAKVLGLMNKHKKDIYACDGVTIERVVEEETVKVKVRKAKEEQEAE